MIIEVSPDMKHQKIYANGHELASIMGKDRVKGKRVYDYPLEKKVHVHTFENPVLMTDNYRIGQLPPTLRDTLISLYAEKPRIVEYDGVSVFWDESHRKVWCPSIDAVLFARAIRKLFKDGPASRDYDTAAEIGCGSGFLSKYVLAKGDLRSILVNDINDFAVRCAMDNIKDTRASFSVGDGLEKIRGQRYDLILGNLPYVLRAGSIDDNPYEGIGLLNHLVHEGQDYLTEKGILLTTVSSLCYDQIFKKSPKMNALLVDSMRVPFKVNNVLNNKAWINYLVKNHCIEKDLHEGYEYWHNINIIALHK